jgi:1-acyl-sn-glycerol-3-phosphate acyltransferase
MPVRTLLTLLAGLIATLVLGPIVIIIAHVNPSSHWIERMIMIWSRVWLVTAGCTLETQGRENVDTTRSQVVVANHLSNLDIMACFLAVPLPIRFLAKTELFKVPVLSSAMRAVGIVEVDRAARSAIHEKVNQQAKALVASGRSLIIYPEGTRSRTGALRSFKKGAFTMAIAAQIPVLPVSIHGTWQAWRPDSPWIRGGRIKVVIDAPISTEGLSKEAATALAERAHAVIEQRLHQLATA